MNHAQELSTLLETLHNVNSTANEQIEETEPEPDTWLDKYVLKFF